MIEPGERSDPAFGGEREREISIGNDIDDWINKVDIGQGYWKEL